VGELDAGGRRLKGEPRRLTLDERWDRPGGWTRDSKAVVFASNRNGQWDIFKQALDRDTAEPVVTGRGDKHDPILSPDGNLILYIQELAEGSRQIMRVPVSGGPPEVVMDGKAIKSLKCSLSPASSCVSSEESPDRKECVFTAFDPMKGRGREITRINLRKPESGYFWDLAKDGSRLAFAEDLPGSERRIQVLPLAGGEAQEIVIKRDIQMGGLAWANDGKGFFVGGYTQDALLLFVDMEGAADVLWKRAVIFLWRPACIPSPDGRHLAILSHTIDSNVWLLENF